ncbi:MAG TPA: type II 3-dehydroquinate dehydratase [Candidatus Manganitrophaceae bacterium]|nr:type II 3-dehydroquinate dehydratase [Candidatus Manganitrophaceae bacterium]
MYRLLVLHGPNLNLLGTREPEKYGTLSLSEIDRRMIDLAKKEGVSVETFQSNSEGALVDKIQGALGKFDALVVNPAAYTHTSVAIRDAILAVGIPTVEVHLSNIHRREEFRKTSMISEVAVGQVTGFGPQSYLLGVLGAIAHLRTLNAQEKKRKGKRSDPNK